MKQNSSRFQGFFSCVDLLYRLILLLLFVITGDKTMRVSRVVRDSRARVAIPATVAVSDAATPRKALLDTQQAAEYLGVSFDTLCGWRVKGVGPRFVKLASGGSRAPIRYRVQDLDAFIEAGLRNSTSDTGKTARALGC
jgi:hypothetical protein